MQTKRLQQSPEKNSHVHDQVIFNKVPTPFTGKETAFQHMVLEK
jgi:hypothetical protein